MNTNKIKLAIETIDFPVHYYSSQQTIRDAKGMMVCDIRGWGKIQFMEKSEERQDAIGEVLAHLLNNYKDLQGIDHKSARTTGIIL